MAFKEIPMRKMTTDGATGRSKFCRLCREIILTSAFHLKKEIFMTILM